MMGPELSCVFRFTALVDALRTRQTHGVFAWFARHLPTYTRKTGRSVLHSRAVRCLLPEGSERKGKSDRCKRRVSERMSQAGCLCWLLVASVGSVRPLRASPSIARS